MRKCRRGLAGRKTKLVLPRAHDCCTILLGSKERFQEHFQDNPSTPFSSVGYLERGSYYLRTEGGDRQIQYGDQFAALVEQYGEDNAKYIWESMHPENADPMITASFLSTCRRRAVWARRNGFDRRRNAMARVARNSTAASRSSAAC